MKSRFSHRQLHMFNSLAFDEYLHLFTVMLCLQEDFPDQRVAADWNKHIEVGMLTCQLKVYKTVSHKGKQKL